jgi:hypothetical protein
LVFSRNTQLQAEEKMVKKRASICPVDLIEIAIKHKNDSMDANTSKKKQTNKQKNSLSVQIYGRAV